jgi:hypothetical protein
MREQAELLGGDFEILSQPGQGTETRVQWPLLRSRRLPWDPQVATDNDGIMSRQADPAGHADAMQGGTR